jgi:hypothetical protein
LHLNKSIIILDINVNESILENKNKKNQSIGAHAICLNISNLALGNYFLYIDSNGRRIAKLNIIKNKSQ